MSERKESLENNYKNYPNSLEFALSLWKENPKILNAQIDQWLKFEQNYMNIVREFYENFSKTAPWIDSRVTDDRVDRFVTFQKSYVGLIRNVSDRFIKETINLSQKNSEKAFSFFDSCFSLFSK